MKIICFHLFNDYSGSPQILKLVLSYILSKGNQVDLISSSGGVLDELQHYANLHKSSYHYVFSNNAIIRALRYFGIQFYTFILAFRYIFNKDTIFYINTILPIGPALAGKIMRKHIIYHYHENAQTKSKFYQLLCWCMQQLASDIICVSHYQRSFLKRNKNVYVIPNALSIEFTERLSPNTERSFKNKTVLMLSSLKLYKGALEFIQLSKLFPQYKFLLVLNDTQNHIDTFLKKYNTIINENLFIYPRQSDVSSFYNRSSLALNLSNKNLVIETFGLTALEAMTAGLPVIVPTVGGIAEMVEDGINGYKIDMQDLDKVADKINLILSDSTLYYHLSKNALQYSRKFNAKNMTEQILQLITRN